MTAVLVVAALALSVVPLVSEGSDAAMPESKSSGIGYDIKDLNGEDLNKFVSASRQTMMARLILSTMLAEDESSEYDIEITDYSNLSTSNYWGDKIDGNDYTTIMLLSSSLDITFKATRKDTAAGQLFRDDYQYAALIKEIGLENRSQAGAVFTVTAYVEDVMDLQRKDTFVENTDGNLVVTKVWNKNFEKFTFDADVKYEFKDPVDAPKVLEYKQKNGSEASATMDTSYEYVGTEASKVTALTKAIATYDRSEFGIHGWDLITYNGEEVGPDTHKFATDTPISQPPVVNLSPRLPETVTAPAYHFYGNDENSMFGDMDGLDPSLRSDDALKAFFTQYGSYSEDYASAESAADSAFSDMSIDEALGLLVIVGAIITGVLVLAVIVLIVIIIVQAKRK